MASIADVLAIALEHHRFGRIDLAEDFYRQILTVEPNHPEVIHLLGVISLQAGKPELAVEYIERAVKLKGADSTFFNNLGSAYKDQGKLREAVDCYRRALELRPDYLSACYNLGNAFKAQGKLDEAIASYRQALKLNPDYADAYSNLGNALKAQGDVDQAVHCYRRALELRPDYPEAYSNLGAALRAQGRLDEALYCYRRAVEQKPDFVEAYINLGTALQQNRILNEAVDCYRRAIELRPNDADTYLKLACLFQLLGQLDEAAASNRRALELQPNSADAHLSQGVILQSQGKLNEAVECYRQAADLKPDFAMAYSNLGNVLREQGKLDEAIACCRRAMELQPDFVEAYSNLANVLTEQGELNEAIVCCRQGLDLKPRSAEMHNNLGTALQAQGKLNDAIECYRQALALNPDFAAGHNNLGTAVQALGRAAEAIQFYRRALELEPDYAAAYSNLGSALFDQGKAEEAAACYRRALELNPGSIAVHSTLICMIYFCCSYDAEAIYEEHLRWNQKFAEPLSSQVQPYFNSRTPNRRLRIGYFSLGFREGSTSVSLLPLLEAHDHDQFEIFCYASVRDPDYITDRCRAHTDVWRDVLALSDEQLAQLIRDDQIDILVDLTMHLADHRLLCFARKPAPVQVTWLGYVATTGLKSIDYRFTDFYLDPAGSNGQHYSEESVRLPDSFWCYDPHNDDVPVNILPALQAGFITFGCLNSFCKINVPTLKLWAQVMKLVDCSRIILLAPQGRCRQDTVDLLEEEGISPERVTFVDRRPRQQYRELYHSIDIVLDTLPYNGHVTSLDCFWMGVPVVTLVGRTVVGRGGLSLLTNLGLPDLVACTPEQFVRVAVQLAQDRPRLSALRAGLRARLQASPLMDAKRFAKNVENAYITMWHRWCNADASQVN